MAWLEKEAPKSEHLVQYLGGGPKTFNADMQVIAKCGKRCQSCEPVRTSRGDAFDTCTTCIGKYGNHKAY